MMQKDLEVMANEGRSYRDVRYSRANKCEYYTEQSYDRDEMFVI